MFQLKRTDFFLTTLYSSEREGRDVGPGLGFSSSPAEKGVGGALAGLSLKPSFFSISAISDIFFFPDEKASF